MMRLTVEGDDLGDLAGDAPAASVRLLIPSPGADELVTPVWNGNEFRLPDGRRPAIRTLTPRRVDSAGTALEVDIVRHGSGALSTWVETARPGDPAAVSGPGRGYRIDPDATGFLLVGDETAIPAIDQLLEVLPPEVPVEVHVEVAHPAARLPLSEHPRASVAWHESEGVPPGAALLTAVSNATLTDGTRVWVAGEAAAVQRIRKHLFDERGLARSHATVRGYWKYGRSAEAEG
jgi:NADPH-dependent ferric siderophore reductase